VNYSWRGQLGVGRCRDVGNVIQGCGVAVWSLSLADRKPVRRWRVPCGVGARGFAWFGTLSMLGLDKRSLHLGALRRGRGAAVAGFGPEYRQALRGRARGACMVAYQFSGFKGTEKESHAKPQRPQTNLPEFGRPVSYGPNSLSVKLRSVHGLNTVRMSETVCGGVVRVAPRAILRWRSHGA